MNTAVLVIDVQTVLFDPDPNPFEAQEVVKRINAVTHWARDKSYPVFFIQHEHAASVIEYQSEGWQLKDELVTKERDLYVLKATPDSFLNTDLQELLEKFEIDHLVICGYATEFCVDTTTRRAAGLGYSIDLVSDAHTTHDKEHASGEVIRLHHNSTLPNISSFGVKISAISTENLTANG